MTLFPEIFNSYFGESIMKRAIEKGIIEVFVYNIRDFSANKHKKVDDYPFGGGARIASWMHSLEKSGRAAERELARVLRRSKKAPRTQRKKNASSFTATAGLGRRTHRSTADVTLGAGRNFSLGTWKSSSASI